MLLQAHMCLHVIMEVRGGHQSPWSYGWPWALCRWLGAVCCAMNWTQVLSKSSNVFLTAESSLQSLRCIFLFVRMCGNSNDHEDLTVFWFLRRDLGSSQVFNEAFGLSSVTLLSALNRIRCSPWEKRQPASQRLSSISHSELLGMRAQSTWASLYLKTINGWQPNWWDIQHEGGRPETSAPKSDR